MGFFLREDNKEKKDNLMVEYNFLQQEIWERSYRTWVVNAIFIIGSLLVAFAQAVTSFPTPVLSILLVAVALILHATSDRLSAVGYARMEEIAGLLKINGPNKMFESKVAGKWWYFVRKNIIYILSAILISIYLFIIFGNFWVLAVGLIVGFLLVLFFEKGIFEIVKSEILQKPKER
jgi:hypothetical protein